jgi:Bacterial Ig-like domain (group 3)
MTMTAKTWLIIHMCFMESLAHASTQAQLVQQVNRAPTTTSVKSSGGSALAGTGVALTITVASTNGIAIPDGTVALSDGQTALGSVPIDSGRVTVSESFSSFGVHQLIACYSGGENFLSSCSIPMSLTTLVPYSLQQGTSSGLVESSKPFVDKLRVIPANGFSGLVHLSCQVPSNQCKLSPASVSFSGNGEPQIVETSFIPSPPVPSSGFLMLPFVGLIGFQIRRTQKIVRNLIFLAVVAALLGLSGCGPVISIPVDVTNFTMVVNSTSGAYSQAVTYQIQVDSDIPKQ